MDLSWRRIGGIAPSENLQSLFLCNTLKDSLALQAAVLVHGKEAHGHAVRALGWQLHPQVAVRPEPFGALLYHFGTRKLSFLKDRTILTIVQSLAGHPDARAACCAAGVEPGGERPYLHALEVLAGSNMLVTKEQA